MRLCTHVDAHPIERRAQAPLIANLPTILKSTYKSLSLKIGKESQLIQLYFKKALIFIFKICTYISIYLFHDLVHCALREVFEGFRGLFSRIKEFQLPYKESRRTYKCLSIKLAESSIITFNERLFRIGVTGYSHNLLFRLFVPLMEINPVFLLISLSMKISSLLLQINSFYYEYSYLSIFAKVHM